MISESDQEITTPIPQCPRPRSLLPTFWMLLLGCCLLSVETEAKDRSGVLIQQMAALEDRSTGSPGSLKAADLIHQAFENLGISKVGRHQFLLPVTYYQTARLQVKGVSSVIRQLQLNAVHAETTPLSGLQGPLIYAGRGELRNFNGMEVEGSIVLMEMDSGKNWLNAAMFGAKALVYVDRGPTVKGFFEEKLELTPISFPRF